MWQTWLLLPFLFDVITCLDLGSIVIGNSTVVFDQNTGSFLCYPMPTSSNLPANHQDFSTSATSAGGTLVVRPSETDARHAARVICRQLGYSHLERVDRVAINISTKARTKRNPTSNAASAPHPPPSPPTRRTRGGPGNTTESDALKIMQWQAECQGYEPVLSYCPNMKKNPTNKTCKNLLGVQCGQCSKTMYVSDNQTVHITSPEYPDYSDAVVCRWRLAVKSTLRAARFVLTFSSFHLPRADDRNLCSRSVLEVEVPDDKVDFVNKTVRSMCGSVVPEPFAITASAIVLRFSSGIFYPPPHDGIGGFQLTVQTRRAEIPPPPAKTLKVGEILTIVLGIILALTLCCFVCYVMKRHRLERRWILQREVMQQRLASHQRPCHDAANLTSMLTGLNLARHSLLARPPGQAEGASTACPPLPTEKKKSPYYPGGQRQPYRSGPQPLLPPPPARRQASPFGDEDELPLYMELEQLKMKDSGVCLLEQSACDTPRGSRPLANVTLSNSCSHTTSMCQACVSPCQGSASCPASQKPPREASTGHLYPTLNTASPTYISFNALDGSVASAESRAAGSAGGDAKCHRPLLYRKLTPSPLPAKAKVLASLSSSCSRRRHHRSSHAEIHSNSLLSPARSLAVVSHGKGGGEEASRGMRSQISSGSITAFVKCDPHPHSKGVENISEEHASNAVEENCSQRGSQNCEELGKGQSSLENVFFSGDPDRQPWRRLVPCPDHALTPEGLKHSAPRAQLSKSCGDVSPPADSTPPWAPEDVHRSEPSLPREALAARIGPALRRVSEMFAGSNPFMTPPGQACPAKDAEGGREGAWTPHAAAFRSRFASAANGFAPFKYNRFGGTDGGVGTDGAPGASDEDREPTRGLESGSRS